VAVLAVLQMVFLALAAAVAVVVSGGEQLTLIEQHHLVTVVMDLMALFIFTQHKENKWNI
jgi:hypothetical protein